MPELPELEVVAEVLTRRIVGRRVEAVTVHPRGSIVVRDLTGRGFAEAVSGQTVASVARRGKFLIFCLQPGDLWLAVNPKLTGRFQLCPPGEKKAGPVHVTCTFHEPHEELRYIDAKRMGQLYLSTDLGRIPGLPEMGPDALEISPEEFARRLRAFRGEIKGILTRGALVAGIGNAYADEILWRARLHPYRKRTDLAAADVARLYEAMVATLREAVAIVRREMDDDIHLKPRDFFAAHMRAGEACPRCGTVISSITANQRITNFCRRCQPGGLIPGMERVPTSGPGSE